VSTSRLAGKPAYASALAPEYALLGFLSQRPAHGYELHRRLVGELGQVWHVSLSQTYNILARLEGQRFIAGAVQAQEKLPARRLFKLTAAGCRHFDAWLQSPTGCSVRAIRVEFTTRLYFASARGANVARDLMDAQTTEVRQGLLHLQDTFDELPAEQTFNRLGLALRIRQLSSILEWLSECRDMLGLEG
jgi:DNA-binding PadR family transcriptional regulator